MEKRSRQPLILTSGARQPSRREALKHLGLGVAAAAGAGCMPAPNRCGGMPPAAPATGPLGAIDTFVVVMMENRSFDHHLGALRSDRSYPGAAALDGLTGRETNPDEQGTLVRSSRMPGKGTFNPLHRWEPSHQAFDGGRNDGFILANAGPGREEVMGYHDRERLPIQYALADQYTVCDRWFASVMGPTWPNRFYLQAGTSGGERGNASMGLGGGPTLWERMADRCLPTRNYFAGALPWYAVGFPARAFSGNDANSTVRIEDFFRDARDGNLPPLSIVDPDFFTNDGHPIHDLALSEVFLGAIYRALAASPQWSRSLLVITYDEHGGFFDHVPPPPAADDHPDFRQLGFRVPSIVVGPTVWQGRVVSTTFDHVSVAATMASRFGIASLGARMDGSHDLSACLDPDRVGNPAPPLQRFPLVELTQAQTLEALSRPASQPEMMQAYLEHRVPEHMVDPRTPEERMTGWLRWAQELEVARVVR
jgi:phospholipase C